jgi:hypothetical protein
MEPAVCFVGIDWATKFHRVCIEDPAGVVVAECETPHSGEGLAALSAALAAYAPEQPALV